MKLLRLARNVILARIAWRYIARRRALIRRRRARRMIAPVLIASGAGAIWVARRRIVGAQRRGQEIATPAAAQPSGPPLGESLRSPAEPRMPGDGKAAPGDRQKKSSSAGTSAHREPVPSPKKRRRRARQQRAEQREKAEREAAHGAKVNVEINETPGLRAPLGDLKH